MRQTPKTPKNSSDHQIAIYHNQIGQSDTNNMTHLKEIAAHSELTEAAVLYSIN